MIKHENSIEKVTTLASRLVNTKVVTAQSAGKGKNNSVYRIETIDRAYALKIYSNRKHDGWDRLSTEYTALSFLYSNGLTCVPKPYVENKKYNCALYQWIEGQPILSAKLKDIGIAVSFLLNIQTLVNKQLAKGIGNASASCFSVDQVLNQIEERLEKLVEISSGFQDLDLFLRNQLIPAYHREYEKAQSALSKYNIDKHSLLYLNKRALSPSDFGIHNILRSFDGRLIFFDFEYFGWDDPVKMVSDVILHPGNALTTKLQNYIFHRMRDYYELKEPTFAQRFEITLPLYALIWCLIILGDFLPNHWARRAFAGEKTSKEVFRKKQLLEAQLLLKKLSAPSFVRRIVSNIDKG